MNKRIRLTIFLTTSVISALVNAKSEKEYSGFPQHWVEAGQGSGSLVLEYGATDVCVLDWVVLESPKVALSEKDIKSLLRRNFVKEREIFDKEIEKNVLKEVIGFEKPPKNYVMKLKDYEAIIKRLKEKGPWPYERVIIQDESKGNIVCRFSSSGKYEKAYYQSRKTFEKSPIEGKLSELPKQKAKFEIGE